MLQLLYVILLLFYFTPVKFVPTPPASFPFHGTAKGYPIGSGSDPDANLAPS
jgi:hypothetical protein